eukprot:UN00121
MNAILGVPCQPLESFMNGKWESFINPLESPKKKGGVLSGVTKKKTRPTPGLSINGNFKIMIGNRLDFRQKVGLDIVFSRLSHETHVEYSTVLGLRGHFRHQNFFGP